MLQISTGKFFEEAKKRRHREKFVFYSNIDSFHPIESSYPEFTVEQVESGSICTYVVSYELITEQHPIIVKCGEQDYVAQFLLAWSFYFNCIASIRRSSVEKICRDKKLSSLDSVIANEISPQTVEPGKKITDVEIEGFHTFLKCLMSLNRKTYRSIIAALRIIADAKESLSTNFDLAYSSLVYCIESLSQKHDGYVPEWKDYHDDVRRKLDPLFEDIRPEVAESMRNALIEGKQFRLRKRVESFIGHHLGEAFFHEYLGEHTSTIRMSFLNRTINNLYITRSSFVHELKPLDVMLSQPHNARSDYIMRFDEPYFTFSGLNRLIREVILNFVETRVTDSIERIDWAGETSSTLVAERAPECWIHNADTFTELRTNKSFSAFIDMVFNNKVVNQDEVMKKIENSFDQSRKDLKRPLIHYYWSYMALFAKDEDKKWISFVDERSNYIGGCIHFHLVNVILRRELSYCTSDSPDKPKYVDLDEFDEVYEDYLEKRFHKNGFSLSNMAESVLLIAAANVAFMKEDKARFSKYLNVAQAEIVSKPKCYEIVSQSIKDSSSVDIDFYIKELRGEG